MQASNDTDDVHVISNEDIRTMVAVVVPCGRRLVMTTTLGDT